MIFRNFLLIKFKCRDNFRDNLNSIKIRSRQKLKIESKPKERGEI